MVAAALAEVIRLSATRWLSPFVPLWMLLPGVLGIALLLVREVANVGLAPLGLRPWRDWTTTERSYFFQVVVIANVVFPTVFAAQLAQRALPPGIVWGLWHVFVPYLFFGFYQELVYRGMVQRELVRRWGAIVGIVVANLLYTFGPLHWYYFSSPASLRWPMFAGIFAIGLFFGAVYQRSGNLWIVGFFHAIGNAYIVWAVGSIR